MFPALNKKQRLVLALAGAIILFIQFLLFSQNGIEGSGWVASVVIAAVLFLPFLGLSTAQSKPQHIQSGSTLPTAATTAELLGQIRLRSAALWERLPQWIGVPDAPALKQINELMTEYWLIHCHTYLFVLISATEARKDRLFLGGEREKVLALGVAQMILDDTRDLAKNQNFPELYNRERALESTVKDMAEARSAARAFITALSQSEEFPDKSLVDYFVGKIGVPPQLRPGFETKLREFTKDTLRSLA